MFLPRQELNPFRPLEIPILSDLPFVGPVFFQQTALTWLALFMVVLVWYIMNRTGLGVAIKAVGDNQTVLMPRV